MRDELRNTKEMEVIMFGRLNQRFAAAALAASALVPAAFAGAAPQYVTTRLPMGPRPDQYVSVRVDQRKPAIAPYALTGQPEVRSERRLVQRWLGARFIGPVWVTERVTD